MRQHVHQLTEASPEQVRARLHDPAAWPAWLDGVVVVGDAPALPGAIVLDIAAPRPLRATVYVEVDEQGLRYTLIEGEFSTLGGRVVVAGEGSGASIDWEQEVVLPVTLSGAFAAELERVLARWAAALGRA